MAKHDSTTQTLAEFHAAVAKEVSAIERQRETDSSALASRLIRFGIMADVKPGEGGDYKVTITPDENVGLPAGTKRADFTAAALAEKDAAHLAREKERIWQHFRKMNINGYYTREQCVNALQHLGYTTLPSSVTTASFSLPNTNGRRDSYGDLVRESVQFTLAGEVSHEDVRARLESEVKPGAALAAARAAFPEATDLPSAVTDLYVHTSQKWPDHSEFYA